jgi:transcriptional regulator with XRE-family HTH domain
MNSVGFKIKRLRERKNISQEEFADKLDISQGTLSKIENGTVEKIDFLFMQKVCDYFEVDPNYFLDGETVINEVQTNNGVVYNKGTFNNFPEDLLKNVVNNQDKIAKLIETQNKLIEKLLKN